MFEGIYRFAGIRVKINSIYEYIHSMCREYAEDRAFDSLNSENCELIITITASDIEYEKEKSREYDLREGIPERKLREPYLETLAVYRKMAEEMAKHNVILFHGSAVAIDGEVYLFTAKSGTGKSTHARLWREVYGDRVVMVNDDKPLIKITDRGVEVYGTPWNGKHNLSKNIHLPLKAICYLNRGYANRIEEICFGEAYPILLQQTYRPEKPENLFKALELIDSMGKQVDLYRLECNMDREAAIVSYEGMNKQ